MVSSQVQRRGAVGRGHRNAAARAAPLAAIVAAVASLTFPATHVHAQADTFTLIAKDDAQRALIDDIALEESRGGTYSPALITRYVELADLYRAGGDDELAAEANDRALQLVRVNEGLYALEQIPLLEQAIADAEQRRDAVAVRDLQQQLQILVGRHPTDERIVPVLRDFGDREVRELRQLHAGQLPAEVRIGGSDPANPFFGSRGLRSRYLAARARGYYASAVQTLLTNQDYTSSALPEIENELVWLNYFYGRAVGTATGYGSPENIGYEAGRRSLLRQVSYGVARDDSLVARVESLVRVADWDLLHVQNGVALQAYEECYAMLVNDRAPAEAIAAIFEPAIPVTLPSFVTNPLDTREAGASGYIDVTFDVHKYGNASNIRVVGASPSATRADKADLSQLIRGSDFRPRIASSGVAKTSAVSLRYYLHPP